MSQQSLSNSAKLETTWAKFPTESAAVATQKQLETKGIAPEKITIETKNFKPRLQLKNTQALANLKTGAITGGVMGALVGLFLSLLTTNFFSLGLAALDNFRAIHYFAPLMGGIVGAVGFGLMTEIGGIEAPKPDADIKNSDDQPLEKNYLVVVKGTAEEIQLAQSIFGQDQ